MGDLERSGLSDRPLHEIVAELRAQLASGGDAEVVVPHPDLGRGHATGVRLEQDGRGFIHRSLAAWCDLAERLGCRLALPEAVTEDLVRLRFEPLGDDPPWDPAAPPSERYDAGSPFVRLHKLEDPRFLLDVLEALERAAPAAGDRVLALGVNSGEELDAFGLLDPALADELEFVGIDHARGALDLARRRHPDPRHAFVEADLNRLDALELGTFDLVLALDVFQSPGVDDRALLRTLVQRHIAPDGRLILSLPNGRYRGGELLYGARTRNHRQPELGLLVKDVAYYRKYLQQHRFRVWVTGKYEVLVVGKR